MHAKGATIPAQGNAGSLGKMAASGTRGVLPFPSGKQPEKQSSFSAHALPERAHFPCKPEEDGKGKQARQIAGATIRYSTKQKTRNYYFENFFYLLNQKQNKPNSMEIFRTFARFSGERPRAGTCGKPVQEPFPGKRPEKPIHQPQARQETGMTACLA